MDIFTVFLIVVAIEAGLYGICCLMCREEPMPEETEDNKKKEDADDLASLRSSCSW